MSNRRSTNKVINLRPDQVTFLQSVLEEGLGLHAEEVPYEPILYVEILKKLRTRREN